MTIDLTIRTQYLSPIRSAGVPFKVKKDYGSITTIEVDFGINPSAVLQDLFYTGVDMGEFDGIDIVFNPDKIAA